MRYYLLYVLMCPLQGCCAYRGVLFQEDFVPSKATPEAKRAFVKAVVG